MCVCVFVWGQHPNGRGVRVDSGARGRVKCLYVSHKRMVNKVFVNNISN